MIICFDELIGYKLDYNKGATEMLYGVKFKNLSFNYFNSSKLRVAGQGLYQKSASCRCSVPQGQ